MSKAICTQKGPYVLELNAGTYYWCSCGKSKSQPFCDGAHEGTDFTPKALEVKSKKTVAFCGCRCTKASPECDGSHNSCNNC